MTIATDNQTVANERASLRLNHSMWGGVARSFRGSLVDNCKRFKFSGEGYAAMPAEQNGHFMLESARHLNGPLLALLDGFIRYTHVIGATQVLKSLCGDIWAVYVLEHLCAAMLVLFEDDPKADLYCQHRAIETIKRHPVLAKMIAVAMEENRHGTTGTRIKTPYSSLLVAGLNEGHVSSLAWQYIWISEAWQHPKDGLLFKAFKRADRFPNTCKILNESQASIAGTDLHRAVKDVHQVPLTWRCPACGGEQSWEWRHWNHTRPDNFVPRSKRTISTVTIGGETAIIETLPKPGSYAGMRIPENEDGRLGIEARAQMAYWECLFCGHHIHDTKSEREAIAETYSQEYRTMQNGILMPPKQVCFVLPFESNKDNRFSSTVKDFLQAKEAKEMGLFTTWQDWFLKDRAYFYDPNHKEFNKRPGMSVGSYETNPENLSYGATTMRQMTVDTGKSPESEANVIQIGQLFFEMRDFDNGPESVSRGASRQITRGMVQDCVMDTPDGRRKVSCWELLAAQQQYWRMTNRHVLIDMGYAPSQVVEAAVKFHEIVDLQGHPVKVEDYGKQVDWASCWRGCNGSADNRIGPAKKAFMESPIPGLQSVHDKSGRMRKISLSRITWSNYSFEDQFERIVLLKTAAVGWEIIPQDQIVIVGLDLKPNAELIRKYIEFEQDNEEKGLFRSWVSGLNSRTLDDKKRKYVDNAKQAYAKGHWTEPRDCGLMHLVGAAAEGMLGHVATEE